jgi:hypothetical protein
LRACAEPNPRAPPEIRNTLSMNRFMLFAFIEKLQTDPTVHGNFGACHVAAFI